MFENQQLDLIRQVLDLLVALASIRFGLRRGSAQLGVELRNFILGVENLADAFLAEVIAKAGKHRRLFVAEARVLDKTRERRNRLVPGEPLGGQTPGVGALCRDHDRRRKYFVQRLVQRPLVARVHDPTGVVFANRRGQLAVVAVDHRQAAPQVLDRARGERQLPFGVRLIEIERRGAVRVNLEQLIARNEIAQRDALQPGQALAIVAENIFVDRVKRMVVVDRRRTDEQIQRRAFVGRDALRQRFQAGKRIDPRPGHSAENEFQRLRPRMGRQFLSQGDRHDLDRRALRIGPGQQKPRQEILLLEFARANEQVGFGQRVDLRQRVREEIPAVLERILQTERPVQIDHQRNLQIIEKRRQPPLLHDDHVGHDIQDDIVQRFGFV